MQEKIACFSYKIKRLLSAFFPATERLGYSRGGNARPGHRHERGEILSGRRTVIPSDLPVRVTPTPIGGRVKGLCLRSMVRSR